MFGRGVVGRLKVTGHVSLEGESFPSGLYLSGLIFEQRLYIGRTTLRSLYLLNAVLPGLVLSDVTIEKALTLTGATVGTLEFRRLRAEIIEVHESLAQRVHWAAPTIPLAVEPEENYEILEIRKKG